MTRADQKEYQNWLELCDRIRAQTGSVQNESATQQQIRKEDLKKDFTKFCKHYFPHYMDSDFGWFHKKAAKEVTNNPNIFCILEWPREHAKSIFANLFLPMYLYARGEVSGMVIASAKL